MRLQVRHKLSQDYNDREALFFRDLTFRFIEETVDSGRACLG